jgi:hypothetical protein
MSVFRIELSFGVQLPADHLHCISPFFNFPFPFLFSYSSLASLIFLLYHGQGIAGCLSRAHHLHYIYLSVPSFITLYGVVITALYVTNDLV